MAKICIIGAGISGLAKAWQLQSKGAECTVLESGMRVGGAIRSDPCGEFLAEAGPNSIQLNSREVESFLESIPGLQDQLITAESAANKRFLVRNGCVYPVPMNPLQALTTPLWSLPAKLRVLREPFISRREATSEESVADFVRRRLGDELYRYAINPLVGGIYAGKPEELSLRYGFPKLYALEQKHGGLIRGAIAQLRASRKQSEAPFKKRIISFKDGLESLPRALAQALGERLETGVVIESIKKVPAGWSIKWNGEAQTFDRLIVTIPAHALTKLPTESDLHDALKPLTSIEYPPVSVLSLGFKRNAIQHPMDGFGVLVPECENFSILGALFPSSFFKNRAPRDHALLTVFVGGDRQPHLSTENPERLQEIVLPDLEKLLGVKEKPVMQHLAHWPRAIPQYKLGYGSYLNAIKAVEANNPGLQLAGNYKDGISLTYCLEAALAEKV